MPKNEEGFTLIEMLIVLFIIGALLLIVLPNLTKSGAEAQEKACQANIHLLETQVENYYLEHGHTWPADVSVLVQEEYLKKAPVCPLDPSKKDAYVIHDDGSVTCTLHSNHKN